MQSIEFCAGAGGQALGLEQAGFQHSALVEIEADFCKTLRLNRPQWDVRCEDMNVFDGRSFKGVDLMAGGLPCPPFSVAGKQLGQLDERNLFPAAIRLIDEIRPKAVMIENVRGFLSPAFEEYRLHLKSEFEKLGYYVDWRLLNSSDFGVPQLRPRVVIVAMKCGLFDSFEWPDLLPHNTQTVGHVLREMMGANGWPGAERWAQLANDIAPTIVGGSKKHGGPDLGPTRARKAWAALGVEGRTIAEEAPAADFCGMPRLTVGMVARLQGFPADWQFYGRKTTAYRQVGNAFPPPVACAVAQNIKLALSARTTFVNKAA
ncbi:MAG: DNA (cytosine-5-)-methyltransferase [Novosphingobium sp. 28-62-57]|uniref:DNA cytosine methyltransferase n=1 Tax=unclassified Novosphingobium TaxID=2644732 RepID=UPI000BCBD9D1|nr:MULTISPECIES: DNA cytosine methyltransferase [unclassified Novosphingobium]OYW50590.1 MAG: DNA (cytosine-5-)-methyltransferase [Novosphingobium sp. 12-62-10]OYZ11392.1 MAG: DNA (cytosine-5-)-methyltransferase [Novosphingobium sp. 28-62-57]OZA32993.1 MAG: DNA (cytosine-5-)-methyltransferase [Novosphingobium sp. 17-62-9]HQS70626.1 DNA cytosine methyltransferase [Novosphingobium sp.]